MSDDFRNPRDPYDRPIATEPVHDPRNTVVTQTGGSGSGWFVAGAAVFLLLIGALVFGGVFSDGDGVADQAAITEEAPSGSTDSTVTGSTTQDAPAPAAPMTPAPEAAAPAAAPEAPAAQ